LNKDLETLNCKVKLNEFNTSFSATCDPLYCRNCTLKFKLTDIDDKLNKDDFPNIDIKNPTLNGTVFDYHFGKPSCGYYQLEGIVSKEGGYVDQTQIIKTWTCKLKKNN
jgi:hypothetical protein